MPRGSEFLHGKIKRQIHVAGSKFEPLRGPRSTKRRRWPAPRRLAVLETCSRARAASNQPLLSVLLLTFKLLGWLVARTPEVILRATAAGLGDLIFLGSRRRRRLVLSNLHHAFPEKSAAWRRRIGRESCHRMVETGLLSLATPYLSERRIRGLARLSPAVEQLARDLQERPRPVVLATLHLALWESQTWLKLLSPMPLPAFGIIFRPLDNAAADRFVKTTRERFGMKLLSRKEGFA